MPKALKLERGTVSWDRFFELAAVETGRIPDDVLEDPQVSSEVLALFRRNGAADRGIGIGPGRWTSKGGPTDRMHG